MVSDREAAPTTTATLEERMLADQNRVVASRIHSRPEQAAQRPTRMIQAIHRTTQFSYALNQS